MIELISFIVQIIIYAVVIMITSGFMSNKATRLLKDKIDAINKLALKNKKDINNLKNGN